jgi:riboflavin kinase/FMN adenylyltransferase
VITTFDRAKLTPPAEGSVVSIGVFDGMHLGHRAILERNVAAARELGAAATVLTFRRHPKHLLLGRAPRTLTTLEHRLELFTRAGIQHTVALAFDEDLRSLSADEFACEIAAKGLGVRRFVLGFDSKFGRDREGGAESLRAQGFDVEVVEKVVVDSRAVSSTAIREAVSLGDLGGAARMLGRPVSVLGVVVHGRNLGARIGFPTANLDLHHELHPPPGVYACRARLPRRGPGAPPLPGVANIGFRPTVDDEPPEFPLVEVHLFDFDADLYGERMELEFVERLRGERRFAGIEELTEQIGRDVARAREVLGYDSPEVPAGG